MDLSASAENTDSARNDMEPQNAGLVSHINTESQNPPPSPPPPPPPQSRHSTGFELLQDGRDSDVSLRQHPNPSSASQEPNRYSTGSANFPPRPSAFQSRPPVPTSSFSPDRQARFMTSSPTENYGVASPLRRSTDIGDNTSGRKVNGSAMLPSYRDCVPGVGSGPAEGATGDGKNTEQNNMPSSEQTALNTNMPKADCDDSSAQRNPGDSVIAKPNSDRPRSARSRGSDDADEHETDGLFGKETGGNDYESLDKRRPHSQHLYRPISTNSSARPVHPETHSPPPPPPPASTQGATSPLYDSSTSKDPSDHSRPEARRFIQPSTNGAYPATDNSDDIIELQSDMNSLNNAQDESQAKKSQKDKIPEITEVPNTNFPIACMVALCFNLPLGLIAMYFSLRAVKAYQDGKVKLGEKRSRWSIVMSLLGITITTVIISSVVLYIAMQGQKRISRQKSFGTKSGLNL